MICVVRRHHVTNVMAFLIITMIMVNLYSLAVVVGGKASSIANAAEAQKKELLYSGNYTTIRFIRNSDGSIRLYTPVTLNSQQTHQLVQAIHAKFKEMRLENGGTVQGYVRILGRIKRALSFSSLDSTNNIDAASFWEKKVAGWPFHVDHYKFQNMGEILRFTKRAQIIQAKNSRRGTQLKIEMILEGGQVALYKPQWYRGNVIINGSVYAGKDRHFGEIAAFYLNQILGYNNAPITVGRRVNLKQVLNFASDQLKETFFRDKKGNLCFYGVCFYCKPDDPVCAKGDYIEGALILLLDKKLRIVANPWRRTYKETAKEQVLAAWETDASYCSSVLKNGNPIKRREVILDIVAVSVFDFLIGNGDRHHFEMYANEKEQSNSKSHSKSILLIDNGKSFGNPNEDYIDILAPLYQCCKIRRNLWQTLKKFRGELGNSLNSISTFDSLYPLLSKDHLSALDRRLLIVLATVEVCLDRFNYDDVII